MKYLYSIQRNKRYPLTIIIIFIVITRKNIITAMQWLVSDLQSGDSLFFHYSGHGGQARDVDGDEYDGFDETLIPMDFKKNGVIVDDDINRLLIRPLIRGVTLHCVIDACHSGTVMDLEYQFVFDNSSAQKWVNHNRNNNISKNTKGGFAVCFSSSSDSQVSADTTMYTGMNIATGAATYAFINAVEKDHATTYGQLLYSIQQTVHPKTQHQLKQQQELL